MVQNVLEMDVHGKLRLVLGLLKDHASIGKAMIYKEDGLSDIEIAVVRATSHDNCPTDDKYMREILFLVSNISGSIPYLAERISRRLSKTRDPLVALKTLLLVHRLLRGGNRRFEQQLRSTSTSGHLQLCPQWFLASSDPSISFLHNYANYIEERMGWLINQAGKLEPIKYQALNLRSYEEKLMDKIFRRLPKYQGFIDKVLNFLPFDDVFRSNNLAQVAMANTLKESFEVYMTFHEGIGALVNMYFDLTSSAKALACETLARASRQSAELHDLYENCKKILWNKHLDYPPVQTITMDHIMALEQCLNCTHPKYNFLSLSHPQEYDQKDTSDLGLEVIGREKRIDEQKSSDFKLSNPFSCNLETKISKVWVVFEDELEKLAL